MLLAPVGPLTNIALLAALRPELLPRIGRVAIMGGSDGHGNKTPAAEFNIWFDPESAARTFDSGLDITMVGLNVTRAAMLFDAGRRAPSAARARSARWRRRCSTTTSTGR